MVLCCLFPACPGSSVRTCLRSSCCCCSSTPRLPPSVPETSPSPPPPSNPLAFLLITKYQPLHQRCHSKTYHVQNSSGFFTLVVSLPAFLFFPFLSRVVLYYRICRREWEASSHSERNYAVNFHLAEPYPGGGCLAAEGVLLTLPVLIKKTFPPDAESVSVATGGCVRLTLRCCCCSCCELPQPSRAAATPPTTATTTTSSSSCCLLLQTRPTTNLLLPSPPPPPQTSPPLKSSITP